MGEAFLLFCFFNVSILNLHLHIQNLVYWPNIANLFIEDPKS